MMHFTETNLKKIGEAIKKGTEAIIHFAHTHLNGNHHVMLLKSQLQKVHDAFKSGKGIRLKFSKTHLRHMTKHGGFLEMLLPFLADTVLPALTGTILPALATGALGGLATWGTKKALDSTGSGLSNFGEGLSNFGQTVTGGCACGSGSKTTKKYKKKRPPKGKGLYQFGTIPKRP